MIRDCRHVTGHTSVSVSMVSVSLYITEHYFFSWKDERLSWSSSVRRLKIWPYNLHRESNLGCSHGSATLYSLWYNCLKVINVLKINFFVTSDLDMSYGKTSDFVSISSFVLIFVIKLTDFDYYFVTNEKWCQVWVSPVENCLILPVFLAYILFCDKIEWCKF